MADAKQRGDPAYDNFELRDSPFFLIARVSGRYVLDMEMVLKTIDMDMPGWRTLMIVREREPSSVSEIADLAVMRLSTMTRVVQRLKKRGLVRIDSRPSDARKTDVYLTLKGKDMMQRVRLVASGVYDAAFRGISASDINQLNDLLRRMFENLAMTADLADGVPARGRRVASRRRR